MLLLPVGGDVKIFNGLQAKHRGGRLGILGKTAAARERMRFGENGGGARASELEMEERWVSGRESPREKSE